MAAVTNTLRHRYPCIRIAIFHGGGCPSRGGLHLLQKQNPEHSNPQGIAEATSPICACHRAAKRGYLPHANWKADEQKQYLGGHEAAMCAGKSKSGQGVPS